MLSNDMDGGNNDTATPLVRSSLPVRVVVTITINTVTITSRPDGILYRVIISSRPTVLG
jgi:hypothetical protein